MAMPFYLNGKNHSESWSVLIEDANGRGPEIYASIRRILERHKVPSLVVEDKEVAPGIIEGMKGNKRPFLMVRNSSLLGFRILIGAGDYGNQLAVWWYMVPITKIWKRGKGILKALPTEMDIFDQQELTSFLTTVHHSVVKASEEVSDSVGFDFSKVDQKSRGFLNIS
jgi:hypothetical protein